MRLFEVPYTLINEKAKLLGMPHIVRAIVTIDLDQVTAVGQWIFEEEDEVSSDYCIAWTNNGHSWELAIPYEKMVKIWKGKNDE